MSKEITASNTLWDFPQQKCKVSGWYNNCGLNCFTHVLIYKLLTNQLPLAVLQSKEYSELLHAFQQYYDLPVLPSWADLRELFTSYYVPTDREAIFAPVLRLYLAKLLQNSSFQLWETLASVSYSEYIKNGESADNSLPLVKANKKWLDKARAEYWDKLKIRAASPITAEERTSAATAITMSKRMLDEQAIINHVNLQREIILIDEMLVKGREHWMAKGCAKYLKYFAQIDHAVMVGANDLHLLGNQLFFSVKASCAGGSFKETETKGKLLGVIKIHTQHTHWEFEAKGIEPTTHNRYYPEKIDLAFMEDDSLSGEFKIRGGEYAYEQSTLVTIKTMVQNFFVKPKCHYSPARKEAEQTLEELIDKLSDWLAHGIISTQQQKEIFEESFELLAYALQQQAQEKSNVTKYCKQVKELEPTHTDALLALKLSSLRLC